MTDIQRALVIGATGHIGRHLVSLLRDRGVAVRALTRDPTRLPGDVEAAVGDLKRVETVRTAIAGTDAVFLLWPFLSAEGAPAVVEAIASSARRVVYVSAASVRDDRAAQQNGVWGLVEDTIRRTTLRWTFLRVSGLASNTLEWAPAIRTGRPVRMPYPAAARSLIHERDVAAVAGLVMTEPGHEGSTYILTGPEAITQTEQVRTLGAVARRVCRIETVSPQQAREALSTWADPVFAEAAVSHWASLVETPERVTDTVRQLTDRPARTFAEWAKDHAEDFLPRSPTPTFTTSMRVETGS
jgi:uncharacterized protein YbjT (DUF2867 family)